MNSDIGQELPANVLNLTLTLALAFFIGLEREEHKQASAGYAFGGVRTFPIIALVSYALALIASPSLTPWTIGFAVVGAFMLASYWHKLSADEAGGLTTEASALATYVVAGLVQHGDYWIATTIAVLTVILLELKSALESLTKRFTSTEIITVAKFLVLAAIVLPVVPNEELTHFQLNPFKTWLVVVAVSGVSFASYVVQSAFKERGGVMLSALLGGAYSSTLTTVVLARQAKADPRPNLLAGCILTASGVMYARLVLLLVFFNRALAAALAPAFGTLALIAVGIGWLVSRRKDGTAQTKAAPTEAKNPLELKAAFLFAFVFVVIMVVTDLVREHMGRAGLYALAAIMGVTDVDPFILGLAQRGPSTTPVAMAAGAIVIAAASNNVIKAVYAYSFADRATGLRSLTLLLALACLGLVPLAWT